VVRERFPVGIAVSTAMIAFAVPFGACAQDGA